MTDQDTRIRDAFVDDYMPPSDRDRLWKTMEQRYSRQARRRFLVRAGLVFLAGAILLAWVFLRMSPTPPGGPIAMHADSMSTDSPMEHSMTQDRHQETSFDAMSLLSHRSNLQMEIGRLENRQLELAQMLNGARPGRERNVMEAQAQSVEEQLAGAKNALSVIDARLAGQPVPLLPTPPVITEIGPPQVITVSGGLSDELIWSSGGIGLLLVLAMFGMMIYMRRIAKLTREALTAVERQVSSQHATLASGIDAIAVEVERLGEGQRFMSKVLSGGEAKAAPVSRT
jgi:hypothetical protein